MRILGEINRGGFGRVEKIQIAGKKIIARKIFSPSPQLGADVDTEKLKRRFRREVMVQSALEGEYFLPILTYDLEDSDPWFTMPLAEKNFRAEIIEQKTKGEVPKQALADILNGLDELHRLGYVHRDLKPENILLYEGTWKLSDFGLVLPLTGTTTRLTSADSSWGTAMYCAPEQLQDFRNVTPAADIYAFGCILHDIVTNDPRVPYQQHTCKGPLALIIEKCTHASPLKRFKNITAVRGALFSVLSRPIVSSTNTQSSEWVEHLGNVRRWTAERLADFARFLLSEQNLGSLWDVFDALNEESFRILNDLDAEVWQIVALRYCEWAHGSFGFQYCDVIARRLEFIFEIGSPELKAAAAIAAAELGTSHNRWFVMECLMRMCARPMDNAIAERIAIEIRAEEAQENFTRCAERISRDISDYHPIIAAVLQAEN